MKPQSKISVIVVCYNQENTIARTLDSIIEQKGCSPFEILVSDDCSQDNTIAIASKYEKLYPGIVKVHSNRENLGVQANYFNAMRRAEGEYIADCAGDDFWCDPYKLKKEETLLDMHPEVSMVHTGFDYIYPDGRKKRGFPKSEQKGYYISKGQKIVEDTLCASGTPVVHLCTALYRKDPIVKAINDHPDIFLNPSHKCEDMQVIVTAGCAGDIAFIPESTLCYSTGIPSISSTENFSKAFDFYFSTTRLRLHLMRMFGIKSERATKTIRKYTDYVMSQAFHEGSAKNLHKLKAWMKKEDIPLSFKSHFYYSFGISPFRRFVSHILLSTRNIRHVAEEG